MLYHTMQCPFSKWADKNGTRKMAIVKELLRTEEDGRLSFGDYTLASKTKLDNFEFEGERKS